MKALKAILARICTAESYLEDLEADRGVGLTRETALGALAFSCLSIEERELLRTAFARETPVGLAETATVERFTVLVARFTACPTTIEARDIFEELHPGYRGFTPTMIRVFNALELAR